MHGSKRLPLFAAGLALERVNTVAFRPSFFSDTPSLVANIRMTSNIMWSAVHDCLFLRSKAACLIHTRDLRVHLSCVEALLVWQHTTAHQRSAQTRENIALLPITEAKASKAAL